MMKFYLCLHNFSEIQINFYRSHGKLFSVSFQVIIIYILILKKKHCKIYKVIPVLIFVCLKLKLRDFLSNFVLTLIVKDELERFRLNLSRWTNGDFRYSSFDDLAPYFSTQWSKQAIGFRKVMWYTPASWQQH